MTQAQELWAIKGPDGEIYVPDGYYSKQRAEDYIFNAISLGEEGYRAVRVRVEEIEEGGE